MEVSTRTKPAIGWVQIAGVAPTLFARHCIEQLLIIAVTITPLIVTGRYLWGTYSFVAVAAPLGFMLLFSDVRSSLQQSLSKVSATPANILGVVLALWAAASPLWSWVRHYSWHGVTKTAGCIIVALVLAGVLRTIPRDRIFPPLIVYTVYGAVIGIFTALSKGVVYRALGCCHDGVQPIMSGGAVVTALLVWPCAGWLAYKRRWMAFAGIIALALVVVSVSRNASAGLMFGAGLLTLGLAWLFPRHVVVVPLVIAALGFLAAPFIMDLVHLLERLGFLDQLGRFHARERTLIWSFFDGLFWQRPWTGYGLRSEQIIGDPGRFAGIYPPPFASMHTHNTPLQILFDFGVVGGALALAGIGAVTYRHYAADPHPQLRFGIAAATAFLAGTLVNYGLYEWWLMTVVLLACVLCRRLVQPDPDTEPPTSHVWDASLSLKRR